jgi:holo-[acyl-carrier protein] synthase
MIKGTGIDIVSIHRITDVIERQGDRFLKRVFTPHEIAYCQSKSRPESHFAMRFAAKEAILKALQTGFAKGVRFQEIEVVNDTAGAPEVHLSGKTLDVSNKKGISTFHISLSDEKETAVALAVAS